MNRLWQRIMNLIAPGTITAVDDTGTVMRAQLKLGYLELRDGVPVLQQFGFSSVPPIGSDAAVIFISGDRGNGVAVATGHQATRPTGKSPGEAVIFNAFGMSIYMSQNGVMVTQGGKPVTFDGDVHVVGNVVAGYGTLGAVHVLTHFHSGSGGTGNGGPPVAGS